MKKLAICLLVSIALVLAPVGAVLAHPPSYYVWFTGGTVAITEDAPDLSIRVYWDEDTSNPVDKLAFAEVGRGGSSVKVVYVENLGDRDLKVKLEHFLPLKMGTIKIATFYSSYGQVIRFPDSYQSYIDKIEPGEVVGIKIRLDTQGSAPIEDADFTVKLRPYALK